MAARVRIQLRTSTCARVVMVSRASTARWWTIRASRLPAAMVVPVWRLRVNSRARVCPGGRGPPVMTMWMSVRQSLVKMAALVLTWWMVSGVSVRLNGRAVLASSSVWDNSTFTPMMPKLFVTCSTRQKS
uniref:Uncharacterized protein n=1 Tax=Timema cristinae TaxID=61476 RepID=A0A7R9D652_TIMCR|nr:unnamed protein product [Timema cristinae]